MKIIFRFRGHKLQDRQSNLQFVTMNDPVPSSEDSRLDEWGNYIKKREDVIRIEDDGVLEAIHNNNPAVTAVMVQADG
eukprot:scaffold58728_cov20-Cyclotella_meneghiniana.AAC.1